MNREDRLRELHTRRFGGASTIRELAEAAVAEGLFDEADREAALLDAAMAVCRYEMLQAGIELREQ
ncbi:MAG: hypothetical protein WD069_08455 [Planctomycetales bacterium]